MRQIAFKTRPFPLSALRSKLFIRYTAIVLLAGFFSRIAATAASPVATSEYPTVTILSTTDLHGRIYPYDYYTQQESEVGLAKVATIVKQVRKDNPATMLLDSGDTIEGTPLVYFFRAIENKPHPMILCMNQLNYDAMAIGNHDFNFGLKTLFRAKTESNFPWLSANIYHSHSEETVFKPYIIKEIAGVKIGVIGLTTGGVPYWEAPENFKDMEFREPVAEAAKWTKLLREREGVDAVVIAMHMGFEYDLATRVLPLGSVPNENAALAIANKVPGIDAILMGHTHQVVSSLVVNGVLMAQAGYWGNHVVAMDLHFARDAKGKFQVAQKGSRAIPITKEIVPDAAILELARPYHEETERWLDTAVGQCDQELVQKDTLKDSALIDLIHRVQLEVGQADISLASTFNPRAKIPAGPVTVRNLESVYIYENTLVVIEATGAQLKAALEHSAEYFNQWQSGKSLHDLINPAVRLYNFDNAQGVDYVVDVSKPIGQRITSLTYHGKPLAPETKFKLALNSYRFTGGGKYDMFKGDPVVFRSSKQLRDMLIEWVQSHKTIPTTPDNNWKIITGQ